VGARIQHKTKYKIINKILTQHKCKIHKNYKKAKWHKEEYQANYRYWFFFQNTQNNFYFFF